MTSNRIVHPARSRILAFSRVVWGSGLVVIALIGFGVFSDLPEGGLTEDLYAYEPWTDPDPTVAEDEGDGIYSGVDGAVIRLDGLDPSQPLLISEIDDTYVGHVTVTGPEGEIVVPGEYGEPPRFSSYAAGIEGIYVVVPSSSAELWIDGFSDERWRLRITTPDLEEHSAGSVSGFGAKAFLYRGDQTTARVSARGEGWVRIETVTAAGFADIFSEDAPADRSIAWADSGLAVFAVDAYSEAGWTIDFGGDGAAISPEPDATASPAADPSATDGSDG